MALGPIDDLLKGLNTTKGKGLPFSLLGLGGEQAQGSPAPAEGPPSPQKSPSVFDKLGEATQTVSSAVQPAQDLSKNISKGIAKSIESGINAIFDIGLSKEDKQLREDTGGQTATDKLKDFASTARVADIERPETAIAKPPLAAPPLSGESTQQAPPVGREAPSGVNRIQEILAQQQQLRRQLRSRRA